jgi:hypothetical protein
MILNEKTYINSVKSEDPGLLVLLGDMVFDGSSSEQWAYFDNLMSPVKEIPVLPVMGNHDYYEGNGVYGLKLIKSRFPHIDNSTWYSRIYGNVALVFLDSNEPRLSKSAWLEQQIWFSETLKELDKDPGIKSVLVFTHHPPYTNSIVTGDEKHIQNAFIKSFMDSEKTVGIYVGTCSYL